MSKDNAKEDMENIKKDIKSLINNLSKLKGDSSEILSESFKELTEVMSNIKGDGNLSDYIPSKGKLLYKGVNYMYGDTIKKTATIVGIAAFMLYLINR